METVVLDRLRFWRAFLDSDLSVRKAALAMQFSENSVERRIASCALETLDSRIRLEIDCLGGLAGAW